MKMKSIFFLLNSRSYPNFIFIPWLWFIPWLIEHIQNSYVRQKGFSFSTDPRLILSPSSFPNISRFHFPLSLLTHLQVFFSYDWQCHLAKVFSLWLLSSPLSPEILHSHISFTSYFSSYTSLFLDFLQFVLPLAMPQLGKCSPHLKDWIFTNDAKVPPCIFKSFK